MGGGVYPSRESRQNSHVRLGQTSSHPTRTGNPLVRRVASADDSHRAGIFALKLSAVEEERRQVVDHPEVGRIVLVQNGDELRASLPRSLQLLLGA